MVQRMTDSFVVGRMLGSFEISDYYTATFNKEELEGFSNFLDLVEVERGVRLPLIPIIDLWNLFMVEKMDCNSCGFMVEYQLEFLERLDQLVEEAYELEYPF